MSRQSQNDKPKAVILLSGGLDSATCLAIAMDRGYEAYALSFDYGQRQSIELQAAKRVAKHLGATAHQIVKLDLPYTQGSSLIDHDLELEHQLDDTSIPSTYVPARNTIFIATAMGMAETIGAKAIFIGASHVDYSGYPDCRPAYFEAWQALMNLATKDAISHHSPITLYCPLLELSKAQTIQQGRALGVDYDMTISCYAATADRLACHTCQACQLRQKGFEEANANIENRDT